MIIMHCFGSLSINYILRILRKTIANDDDMKISSKWCLLQCVEIASPAVLFLQQFHTSAFYFQVISYQLIMCNLIAWKMIIFFNFRVIIIIFPKGYRASSTLKLDQQISILAILLCTCWASLLYQIFSCLFVSVA